MITREVIPWEVIIVITKMKSVFGAGRGLLGRLVLALSVAVVSVASAQTEGTITEAQFTELSTQILTYLGYAIAAGLVVLVAVIGARRAWTFMRGFL